ncbi:MAG: SipW-dependent-type signal peptide-containing protein [Firmicutes bacterium]|nr:SipW-dependent-type signal peptide-containing protein [Bacillota bacterium]
MKKKILSLTLVVCLLAIAVVGGTLAYFTDTDNVATNTFTVGNVEIKLDEAKVDLYGEEEKGANRVTENTYKLIPGHEYTKDPMVTVKAGSEESYVRMFVTIKDATDVKAVLGNDFLPQYFVKGWDATKWVSTNKVVEKDDTLTYEFRYHDTVNTVDATEDLALEALFTSFELPDTLTNEQIAKLQGLEIVVVAQAIQADGFASEDAAFAELPAVPAV